MEVEYRSFRRSEDDMVLRVVGAAAVVSHVAFVLVDRELVGGTPAFAWLVAARCVFVAFSVMAMTFVPRFSLARRDLAVAAGFTLGAVLHAFITSTRPLTMAGPLVSSVIAVVFTMVVVPIGARTRTLLGLATCAAYLLGRTMGPSGGALVAGSSAGILALSFGAATLLGMTVQRSRRREFLSLREQRDLRASLEKALAEIKTLRGILPMCSFCKDVRDEHGAWHRIDIFVRQNTHAQVSHGFCPACEAEHYADV